MKKVFKYATGEAVPEGAVYLHTVTQTNHRVKYNTSSDWEQCWFVWHYFLVEVEEQT